MANSTLLSLVQSACNEMGLITAPTSVVGNSTQDVVQLLALTNSVGNELVRAYDWQTLVQEYRFTTVYYTYTGDLTSGSVTVSNLSGTTGLTSNSTFQVLGTGINQDTYLTNVTGSTGTLSQAATASGTGVSLTFCQTKYAMPSAFDRQQDRTHWDKTKHWEMLGPETAQQTEWLKSGFISTGPRIRYYFMGGYFQIWPAITSNEYLGFNYISKNWVLAAADTITPSKAAFSVDTDTCIFPDRLMIDGIKLKFFQIKGFDTTALQRSFDTQLSIAWAADKGSQTLSMAPRISTQLLTYAQIPDSGYGS